MAVTSATPLDLSGTSALAAYEALAPFYDDFTADYAHEAWLSELERLATRWGGGGHRLLDVGCGTGKSALPLQRRGYAVTACDISPTMVATARRRLDLPAERCFVADMRRLPGIGPFDLVLCLDDAVNYLLAEEELVAALSSMGRTLSAGGLLLFDVNTLATYVALFAGDFSRSGSDATYHWRGRTSLPVHPGQQLAAEIEIVRDGETLSRSLHVQRHYPPQAVAAAIEASGLTLLETLGQSAGGRLSPSPDESRHSKLVYVVRG